MKTRTVVTILTVSLFVFWVAPLEGKKIAPEVLGTPGIQWTCAVIVAVLIPIVVLLSLNMIFGVGHRRAGLAFVTLACLPLLYNLTMYGIGGVLLARTNLNLLRGHERDSELIGTLSERAIAEAEPEDRAKSAGILYSMFGVQPIWKNSEGDFEQFYPTVDQQERWADTVDTAHTLRQTTEMIDVQLKQMPWLFGLNLLSFCMILFLGLGWRAYKPISEQVAAGPPATTPRDGD
ncbi:hypothetical protein HNR46_004297 [Haloferula luteola]|uniref:Uncharacterized protein n=1 Tax=Haloferula luteola TaxID=595692 RepID=A0A840V7N0_9BACT|nr:hypothetical protein [Haloferula luteola]MBB5354025.1 hypothetical protein [Haloferula luteola]